MIGSGASVSPYLCHSPRKLLDRKSTRLNSSHSQISYAAFCLRQTAPRFLNLGDRFELPLFLQNQTDRPIKTEGTLRSSHPKLTDGQRRRLAVPAHERVQVPFP